MGHLTWGGSSKKGQRRVSKRTGIRDGITLAKKKEENFKRMRILGMKNGRNGGPCTGFV